MSRARGRVHAHDADPAGIDAPLPSRTSTTMRPPAGSAKFWTVVLPEVIATGRTGGVAAPSSKGAPRSAADAP